MMALALPFASCRARGMGEGASIMMASSSTMNSLFSHNRCCELAAGRLGLRVRARAS